MKTKEDLRNIIEDLKKENELLKDKLPLTRLEVKKMIEEEIETLSLASQLSGWDGIKLFLTYNSKFIGNFVNAKED